MKQRRLRHWLSEEPFTLALSSAFFGFYAHCGVAAALYEAGLRPAKLSGASAGALVAAALASGVEPAQLAEICFSLSREDFWDPAPGLGFLQGKKFAELLRPHLAQSFENTKIPLEVAVFDVLRARTDFLREGPLVPAVVASCAVPLLFRPVWIRRRPYLDGGIREKAGFRAGTEERVLCAFIESRGISGAYEWGASKNRFSANHRVLRLRNLPAVRPHNLSSGRAAFDQAYGATRAYLNSPA